jgi:hypothetical protein
VEPLQDGRVSGVQRDPGPGLFTDPHGKAQMVAVVVGDQHTVQVSDLGAGGLEAGCQGLPRVRVIPASVDQDRAGR